MFNTIDQLLRPLATLAQTQTGAESAVIIIQAEGRCHLVGVGKPYIPMVFSCASQIADRMVEAMAADAAAQQEPPLVGIMDDADAWLAELRKEGDVKE